VVDTKKKYKIYKMYTIVSKLDKIEKMLETKYRSSQVIERMHSAHIQNASDRFHA
jgi:hypothetical protein